MKLGYKIKPRDAKSNPTTAILAAVFVMFLISGLLLLLLALLLYKMEPGESVIKIGIVAVYVISGLCGGFLMGKRMREQKFLWGLAAGIIYFLLLFGVSLLVKGTGDLQMTRIFSTLILCGGIRHGGRNVKLKKPLCGAKVQQKKAFHLTGHVLYYTG